MTTRVIVCLDGCGPDYFNACETPNLDAMAREGFHTIGEAVVPTVTNVNNTSIITACLPQRHGITSNYYLDAATGNGIYMESPDFLLAETAFRRIARGGGRSVLLTAKDKLKTLIRDVAAVAESAERPSPSLVDRVGEAPGIYTIEVNLWLLRAAAALIRDEKPDFIYVSTTDFATHAHPPESEPALRNIHEIDRLIGEIVDASPGLEIVVTADHGMNAKTRALDLGAILADAGILAQAVPIIKDRHVVHHRNLGGAAYIYLGDPSTASDAAAALREEEGVESVLDAGEAAAKYGLHPGRIGNLFLLADRETVFGDLARPREEVRLRSHGSLHERQIPIYALGKGPLAVRPRSNPEVAAWLFPPHRSEEQNS